MVISHGTIRILPNISQSKDKQTMKFGQLIEYSKRNFFSQKTKNDAGGLVPDLNKNNTFKTLDSWSRGMLNFHSLEKGLGIIFPPHFVYDFSRKTFITVKLRLNAPLEYEPLDF